MEIDRAGSHEVAPTAVTAALDAELAQLVDAADVPLVVLDVDVRVARATPAARDLLGLTSHDLGRPLAHAGHPIARDLAVLARAVMLDLQPRDREATSAGRHLLLRVRSHRALDGSKAGVVVALIDVTRFEEAVDVTPDRARLTAPSDDGEIAGRVLPRVELVRPLMGQGGERRFRLPITQEGGTMVTMTAQEGKVRATKVVAGRRRVLVVDDNPDVADTIGDVIDMLGHDVRVAQDGVFALALAETFRPDLVLLDIGMPGMDGCEVARRLRAQPGGEAIVLVALTGWGQPQDVEMIMDAGFDQHVVKPIALATLREVLAKVRE